MAGAYGNPAGAVRTLTVIADLLNAADPRTNRTCGFSELGVNNEGDPARVIGSSWEGIDRIEIAQYGAIVGIDPSLSDSDDNRRVLARLAAGDPVRLLAVQQGDAGAYGEFPVRGAATIAGDGAACLYQVTDVELLDAGKVPQGGIAYDVALTPDRCRHRTDWSLTDAVRNAIAAGSSLHRRRTSSSPNGAPRRAASSSRPRTSRSATASRPTTEARSRCG